MDVGIDFRATSGYVTDPAGCTYHLDETYPVTRGGATFGMDTGLGAANSRDRSTLVDPRLAGIVFRASTTAFFRLDLDATGSCSVHLALGDATGSNPVNWVLKDNTTTLVTYSGTASLSFQDALGNSYNAAAWPGSEQATVQTFASTILKLQANSAGGNNVVAHVRAVTGGGAAAAPWAYRFTRNLSGPSRV